MAIYRLGNEPTFPPSHLAEKDGLLAVGGELNSSFIIEAYANGIFPWFNVGEPILWWSPNPRSVIFVKDIHVSKSMKKILKRFNYSVSLDRDFEGVIRSCKSIRPETWITDGIEDAYGELFKKGVAHSVEVWDGEELIGGLYGIALGRVFYGESMFSKKANASKIALIKFCKYLEKLGFRMIDCQVHNNHLESMGAIEISRDEFLRILGEDIQKKGLYGRWKFLDIK